MRYSVKSHRNIVQMVCKLPLLSTLIHANSSYKIVQTVNASTHGTHCYPFALTETCGCRLEGWVAAVSRVKEGTTRLTSIPNLRTFALNGKMDEVLLSSAHEHLI